MSAMIISVQSSFIESAMYNDEKQSLRLEINGTWYYYYGITKQKMYRFRNASSKGKYFCKFIKGRYECMKRRVRTINS